MCERSPRKNATPLSLSCESVLLRDFAALIQTVSLQPDRHPRGDCVPRAGSLGASGHPRRASGGRSRGERVCARPYVTPIRVSLVRSGER